MTNMRSNQNSGDIYPKRPCHLIAYVRQLMLRVNDPITYTQNPKAAASLG